MSLSGSWKLMSQSWWQFYQTVVATTGKDCLTGIQIKGTKYTVDGAKTVTAQ